MAQTLLDIQRNGRYATVTKFTSGRITLWTQRSAKSEPVIYDCNSSKEAKREAKKFVNEK